MVEGKVFHYGDNVDTDVIIPARYLNVSEPSHLAAHCMEDIDSDFVKTVQEGDIIVAARNFGCGSSREHAPIAIKASGSFLRDRKLLRQNFLSKCHQYRIAYYRVPGSGG